MRILVTNDDGIHSPGLRVLADAALRFGEARVFAPDVEQSSMAHAVTATRPLHLRPAFVGEREGWRVDGTPADCVALGSHAWERVDMVFSGINLGYNVGNSMWHSGTLAAAKQAALLGIRGIAFSAPPGPVREADYDSLRECLDEVIAVLVESDVALVNVNLPMKPRGIRWTRQSVRHYDGRVLPGVDPLGREHYWFAPMPLAPADEGTDRWAVEHGYASVTPLRLDLTDHAALERMREEVAAE